LTRFLTFFRLLTPQKNNEYYISGKLSLLDSKNEWHIDETAKKIYLYSDTARPLRHRNEKKAPVPSIYPAPPIFKS
jgi:hypothetical protein